MIAIDFLSVCVVQVFVFVDAIFRMNVYIYIFGLIVVERSLA